MSAKHRLQLVIAAAIAAGLASPARADFITGFVGNTRMADVVGLSPQVDGIVNFAVYDNSLGDFSAVTGLSTFTSAAGAPSLSAPFIYLFQVVNIDSPVENRRLSSFLVDNTSANFTGMGFFTDKVFNDGSPVGPASNPALGATPVGDDVVDGSPSTLFTDPLGFSTLPVSVEPIGATLNNGSGFAVFEWKTPQLTEASGSALLFLSSAFGPHYTAGLIQDGNLTVPSQFTSNGDVPSATPEPGTLALLFAGAPVAALWALRRRRLTG